uniref:Uncharacterized protein n=1 Tax=Arundo donax TaxID=35708 RepID=A0A0A9DBW3_ARUDO
MVAHIICAFIMTFFLSGQWFLLVC